MTRTVRLACCLASLAACCGCSLQQASAPVYADYCQLVPFRCDRPLARELRYTYTDSSDIGGGPDGFVAVADDTTLDEARQTNSIRLLSTKPTLSDTLSARGSEAAAAGDTSGSYMYRDLAVSAARVESAMDQIAASANLLNTYASAMSALKSLSQAWAKSDAESMCHWLREKTGCIGDDAPPGSVLHVDFNKVVHATAFTVSSRIDFEVTAVLDDGRGNILRAERGYPLFTYRESSPPGELPAGAAISNGPAVDARALEQFETEPFLAHLSIAANAAIAELHRQREELEGSRGSSGTLDNVRDHREILCASHCGLRNGHKLPLRIEVGSAHFFTAAGSTAL